MSFGTLMEEHTAPAPFQELELHVDVWTAFVMSHERLILPQGQMREVVDSAVYHHS